MVFPCNMKIAYNMVVRLETLSLLDHMVFACSVKRALYTVHVTHLLAPGPLGQSDALSDWYSGS